ncbi:Lipopolysaccharide 1,2-glucosyltransferase [Leminorella grimontii]|nr:Lipopolysaccharide 1,2-glucosyltransferase [Leminorella grimontii]
MSKTYFNEAEVIRTVMDFNHSEGGSENAFNIAYGIDKNFLFGCGVSIASVLLSNPSGHFVFHVFTDYFSDDDRQKFDDLAAQYKTHISVYLIDCEKLKSLPSTKNWTYAIYFRFIIFDYFASRLDRILYLDADIVCQNSVDELLSLEFAGGGLCCRC